MRRPWRRFASATVLLAAVGVLLFAGKSLDAGVVGSPHDFSSTGPYTKTLGVGGVCSVCHIPHGARDVSLWPRFLGDNTTAYRGKLKVADGNGDNNYIYGSTLKCYDCHDYAGNPPNMFTGDSTVYVQNVLDEAGNEADPPKGSFTARHRPQDVAFGLRYETVLPPAGGYDGDWTDDGPGGTVPGYFENDPPNNSPNQDVTRFGVGNPTGTPRIGGHYFKSGSPKPSGTTPLMQGDKIPCSDCHDPHDYTSQAFIRSSVRGLSGASTIDKASEYMSNKVSSSPVSRLRNNLESRNMCNACHTLQDTGVITYRQINDNYVAYDIVQRPKTIEEHLEGSSAPCTQCHSHNNIFASCSQCHGYPPSSTANPAYPASPRFVPTAPIDNDSHPRHYGGLSGQARTGTYRINCEVCHYGSTGTGGSLGMHQNDNVSVVLQGAWTKNGGTYDNTNYFNLAKVPSYPVTLPSATGQLDNTNGTGGWGHGTSYGGNACRNVYCHSAGRVQTSMGLDCTVEYRVPLWNSGPQHCNDCHGYGTDNTTNDGIHFGMPDYPTGSPGSTSANSHRKHIDAGYECYVCHAGTVDNNYTGPNRRILATTPTKHVNGFREVVFDGVKALNGTYDDTQGVKTCGVSCHGIVQPQWGGTLANGCFGCHSGAEATDKPQDNVGIPNPVDNNEYLHSGHGRPGPTTNYYPGSGNSPAGFSNYTTGPADCYYCHSQNAPHTPPDRTNDPFRLGSGSDTTGQKGTLKNAFADNTDLLCLGCHGNTTERSGHDNAATGATTIDAKTHARGVTGTKYNWPGSNYPWKCVDCHDPHGDGKSTAERYMMLRSGINAPNDNNDASAGSDGKSRTKRTGTSVRSVTFNSVLGFATGSYAQSGNNDTSGPWGPCEVCHTQTTAYNRKLGLDNAASHASRTNRCTTCHPHKSGFAATACKGCHGPESIEATAPEIGKYWLDNTGLGGHGRSGINLECEACHDVGYLSGGDHKTGNLAGAGPPPANINTLLDRDQTVFDADRWPNRNTAHLKQEFFPASIAGKYSYVLAFNAKCGNPATGCHMSIPHNNHPVVPQGSSNPLDNVMTFGQNNTVSNPKLYYWYDAYSSYKDNFWRTRTPWTINDLTTDASGAYSDNNVQYGICVTCHDPHGTDAPKNLTGTTNRMLRGNTKSNAQFCAKACHTSRQPP